MEISNKQKVVQLLKSLETGNPEPINYINKDKYIQHNLAVEDGLDGVKKLIEQLPKNTKASAIRIFEDGNYLHI